MSEFAPGTEEEVRDCIRAALAEQRKLEVRGGGTKAELGTPDRDTDILSTQGLTGIVDYDPSELVMTVRAGTPLVDVQRALAEANQHLAFEPYGNPQSTIGGIVAAGISGSRRLSAGAVRDYVLGFRAVSGRGEIFVAGGKVVKNVTGYDLSKLVTGSWGRLAALVEVTLKCVPAPQETETMCWHGIAKGDAWPLMARAMGMPTDVAAAAYLPGRGQDDARIILRLEGFRPSINSRKRVLSDRLGSCDFVEPQAAAELWTKVRGGSGLEGSAPLWRISVPARRGLEISSLIDQRGGEWLADWAGGLIWARIEGYADDLRQCVGALGGHATLVEAKDNVRREVAALHLPVPGIAALNRRVRRAFDPGRVFETGRFMDEADADTV